MKKTKITPVLELPEETEIETPDWTETTHSKEADPDYTTVFPDDKVMRFDINIDADYWASMQADLDVESGRFIRAPEEEIWTLRLSGFLALLLLMELNGIK